MSLNKGKVIFFIVFYHNKAYYCCSFHLKNQMMTKSKGILLFAIILLSVTGCVEQTREFSVEGHTILLDSVNSSKDSAQEEIIEQYSKSLEADMNRVLVHSQHVMERGTPEGTLNNFVADLVFDIGQEIYHPQDGKPIDFCLLNYGGLRVPLPEGEITYGRVFELLPFENEMVVVTLSGEKTYQLFQYLAESSKGMPVSGIELTISNESPESIMIQGKKFNKERTYKVLTSDYLAGGGDSMNFFLQPIHYELLGMRVRDAIILHMQNVQAKGEEISAELDGRISYAQ